MLKKYIAYAKGEFYFGNEGDNATHLGIYRPGILPFSIRRNLCGLRMRKKQIRV